MRWAIWIMAGAAAAFLTAQLSARGALRLEAPAAGGRASAAASTSDL